MIQWLGTPASRVGQYSTEPAIFRWGVPMRRTPVLRASPSRYTFELVRILPDCREVISWSEGPVVLTQAQANARWAQVSSSVSGVNAYPGEGLQLRAWRAGSIVLSKIYVSPPSGCSVKLPSGAIAGGTLGQGGCQAPPCSPGQSRAFDPSCPTGTVRCNPSPIEPCPSGQAFNAGYGGCVPITCRTGTLRNLQNGQCESTSVNQPPPCDAGTAPFWDVSRQAILCLPAAQDPCPGQALGPNGCVPIDCPPGTVRNTNDGSCSSPTIPPPAPGECLDAQEVVTAQPCFYFDQSGNYVGPPELVQGVDIAKLYTFCSQTYAAGYFNLPLCDPSTLPSPPSCIDPETRRILTYCTQQGAMGPDRAANYFCWLANKSGPLFGEWLRTSDCPVGQVPIPGPVAPPRAPIPPLAPSPYAAKKGGVAVPLLIGAAIIGGAALLLAS